MTISGSNFGDVPPNFHKKHEDKGDSFRITFPKTSGATNRNPLDGRFVSRQDSPAPLVKYDAVTIDDHFFLRTKVDFDQNQFIRDAKELPKNLKEINLKFNGLCEIICNKILIEDLLGKHKDNDFFKNIITTESLDKEHIVKSHLLNVYSIFNRMVAFLFGIYPDNIFSTKDQWKLVKEHTVNKEILLKGLKAIDPGITLKLEIFQQSKATFTGHSLLIKKMRENNFILFDPNVGELRGFTERELLEEINDQLKKIGGTDILLSKGESYLKRLKDQKIIKSFNKTIT